MSLEEAIQLNTAALIRLTDAMAGKAQPDKAAVAVTPKPPKAAPESPKAAQEPATPAPATPPASDPAELQKTAKKLLLEVIAKVNREAGKALLGTHPQLSAVPVAELPAFIEAAQKALAK